MLKVGLTGSIAVGKSFVLSVLRDLGCVTFDADTIAHSVMEPGRPAYEDIVSEFGSDVLAQDGSIDRAKLGEIVFAQEARRKRLNEIVHPRVIEEQDRLLRDIEKTNPEGIAVIDAALIIESGGYRRLDRLIVAFCDREIQIERLMRRNRITREDADRRIAAQMSSDEKRRYADYEIDTSGTFDHTRERVIEVFKQLAQTKPGQGSAGRGTE
ncbi:MAG TPA: dephospho-CoA kinase [Blastocatellia bacterium]|nr:dephospho-CoA kinase [Blastocatellia bacterium]